MKSLLSNFSEIKISRVFAMPTFLVISGHSPENCPMFNEKARKVVLQFVSKLDELSKKHGIKNLGGWDVYAEHLSVMVFEAPSLDAFQKFGMEPEIVALSAYVTYEIKSAVSMEESIKMLKQAK